jgi:hypothetical protein
MATTASTGAASDVGVSPYAYEDERGNGWVAFAGIMIALVGTLNVIYGIAAISNSKFFFHDVTYILSDLKTYGWLATICGALQVAAGFGIFARSGWARWVGIITASLNIIIQLLYVSAYPFASLSLMAIDILIIYALVAYGKNSRAAF